MANNFQSFQKEKVKPSNLQQDPQIKSPNFATPAKPFPPKKKSLKKIAGKKKKAPPTTYFGQSDSPQNY